LEHFNDCKPGEAFNYLQTLIGIWIDNSPETQEMMHSLIAESIIESSNHPDNAPAYLLLADKLKDWIETLIEGIHDSTKRGESIAEILMMGGWKLCNLYVLAVEYLQNSEELFPYVLLHGDKIQSLSADKDYLLLKLSEFKKEKSLPLAVLTIKEFNLEMVNIGKVYKRKDDK